MNKNFKSVWNQALGAFVAVSENATTHQGAGTGASSGTGMCALPKAGMVYRLSGLAAALSIAGLSGFYSTPVWASCVATSTCAHTATGDGVAPPTGPFGITISGTVSGSQIDIAGGAKANVLAGANITPSSASAHTLNVSNGSLLVAGNAANRITINNSGNNLAYSAIWTGGGAATSWVDHADINLTGPIGSRGVYASNGSKVSLNNVRINQTSATASGQHAIVIAEGNNSRMYIQDSSVVMNGGGTGLLSWFQSDTVLHATNTHVGTLYASSTGATATSGSTSYVDDSDFYSQGSNSMGGLANANSRLYLNGVDVVTDVRLGINSADWTTYGRPVDAGGSLITSPNDYVASGGSASIGVQAASAGSITLDESASGRKVSIITLGNNSIGAQATGTNSRIFSRNAVIETRGDNAYGMQAINQGQVNASEYISNTNTVKTLGENSHAVFATGTNSTVKFAGTTAIETRGKGAYGVYALNAGKATLNGQVDIKTKGDNAYAILIDGASSNVETLVTNKLSTTGANAHAISVQNSASKTFAGTTGNILPTTISVTGNGAAVLHAKGSSSAAVGNLTLAGATALNVAMTGGTNTWGAKAEDNGVITLAGSSSSGGTGLWATGTGKLNLTGNAQMAGSRIKLDGSSELNVSSSSFSTVETGSLEGATGTKINLGSNTLSIGHNNAANNGSLINNANYAGQFVGSGGLVKTGTLTQILSGAGNTVASIDVLGGTLSFQQTGTFSTTGNYTTQAGATTHVGTAGSKLSIDGTLEQKAGSTLNVTLGAAGPDITANQVILTGSALIVNGFSDSAAPVKASDISVNRYTLITSTQDIVGDFSNYTNAAQLATGLDYLLNDGFVTPDKKNYEMGFRLAWDEGGNSMGTGDFTLASGTAFEVDTALNNKTGSFASGWNGQDLNKYGEGRLILSANNGYTGKTTIHDGRLELAGAGDISASNQVSLTGSGAVLDISNLTGTSTTINRLEGVAGSQVIMGGKDLTVDNPFALDNTVYAGDISGTGSLIKNGLGELTLLGNTAWTGTTNLNTGALTLDGINGKGQLVGDLIAVSGTTFKLQNNASFTGQITNSNVMANSGSTWNMTADSLADSLSMNGGSITFTPPVANTYKTLTVSSTGGGTGALNGQGVIHMNTNLAAQQGDQIITESTSGTHTISITNQGGSPTAGGQSLMLIDVTGGAAASNGQFSLLGGYVEAGAYRYNLVKGGQVPSGIAGNWYLYNAGYSILTENAIAATKAARYATVASLNDVHKRLGELRLDQSHEGDIWLRTYRKSYDNRGGTQGTAHQNVTGLEIGIDHVHQFNASRLYYGGLLGGGYSTLKSPTGSGETNNVQIGAYATWVMDNGTYVDLVGRHFWFKRYMDFINGNALESSVSKNNVLSMDIEVGHRFDFNQGWFVEPQLEVTWLRAKDVAFRTSAGNELEFNYGNTVLGRAGLTAGRTWQNSKGTSIQTYGRVDYLRDLASKNEVVVNSDRVTLGKEDASWVGAIGLQVASKQGQFHIEVESGLNNATVKQKWGVNFGVRWSF